MIEYADDNCLSNASSPMERGVGRIYSQSRGRGHRKFTLDSLLLFSPPPNPKCAPRSLPLTNEYSFARTVSLISLP